MTTHAADGDTCRISLLFNGIPVYTTGDMDVTAMSHRPRYTTRNRQVIGKNGEAITQSHRGHEGDFTVPDLDVSWHNFQASYDELVAAGGDPDVAVIILVMWKNPAGAVIQTREYVYNDVKITDWPHSIAPDQDAEFRVTWQTGNVDRKATA